MDGSECTGGTEGPFELIPYLELLLSLGPDAASFCLSVSRISRSCGSTNPNRGRFDGSPCQQAFINCQHSSVNWESRSGRTPVMKTTLSCQYLIKELIMC